MGHQPELQIEQRKLLDLHLELVLKENERSNLTRIVDWQQGQLLHIEDSCLNHLQLLLPAHSLLFLLCLNLQFRCFL